MEPLFVFISLLHVCSSPPGTLEGTWRLEAIKQDGAPEIESLDVIVLGHLPPHFYRRKKWASVMFKPCFDFSVSQAESNPN